MARRAKPVLDFSPEHPAIEEVMSAKDIAGLIGLLNPAPDPRNLEAVERALNSVMQEYLETKAQRHEYVFLETEDGRGAVGLGRPAPTHAEVNATLDVFLKALHKLRGILAEHPSLDLTVRQDESWPSGLSDALLGLSGDPGGLSSGGVPRARSQHSIAKAACVVYMIWGGLDDDTKLLLTVQIPILGRAAGTSISDLLVKLESAARKLLEQRRQHRGPTKNTAPMQAVGRLSQVWEEVTGTVATHTPRGKAGQVKDSGLPHSAFGLFVVAFFAIVDKGLPKTTISSAIAQVVQARGNAGQF